MFENTNVVRRDNKIIIKNVAALGDAGIIELYSDDEVTKVGEMTAAGVGDFTTLKKGGISITPTAAQINLLTQGVAAGYKIARGTLTQISASDTVVTGLATVVAAVASLKGAPSLTHMFVAADIGTQAGAPAAGSILIKSYKPTGAADVTPLAATTPCSAVDWIAIGV